MSQLQTFMKIERGLLFTSGEVYFSNFPNEDMDLGELSFEGGVPVSGVESVPWIVQPKSSVDRYFWVPGISARFMSHIFMKGDG